MFEVVDADLRRFFETDRTEVSGHFQTALVRLFDHGAQFVARDVHVSFERGGALVGPVVHHAAGVDQPFELEIGGVICDDFVVCNSGCRSAGPVAVCAAIGAAACGKFALAEAPARRFEPRVVPAGVPGVLGVLC